jgi:hypothetical protein
VKTLLTAMVAVALAGCATPASQTATATTQTTATGSAAGATRIVIWSVNSDGPDFRAILTGGVGDYGPAVTVLQNGAVDPEHTSEMELNLSRGSFRLSIVKFHSELAQALAHWRYDPATCSVDVTVTSTVPIVAGSGTGAYRGIAGAFTLTTTIDEVDVRQRGCNGDRASGLSPFLAQLIAMEGAGNLS